ncbi:DNA integrity scanning protein DisA nucleotide-binding domain protein [Stratiformator vulcanicus]|uniref:DNA integrity scanning protein DisA n=1 Tax=Stratiformator vulcanicus TaxID=2527980 RepID=A0A517R210_9PLAN|nr:DNA integrity scanning protein DisA nucleotide-binding domain protein [Stratiformator vulcanicus]QDT37925.1 DNA integrity scanning protein DisA [Stratiformator vulcanicus]
MKRVSPSDVIRSLIASAKRVADECDAEAVLLLADVPFEFSEMTQILKKSRLVVASDKPDVQRAAHEDGIDSVPLLHEPQTRSLQVTQALLEAIADDLLQPGGKVVCVYSLFERDVLDTVSIVNLADQLSRLTARDLRRLETTVPLETLRLVVDLAVEVGREGREGKSVGTMFVVGDHRKVLPMTHEQVHDPFKGYGAKDRMIRSPRVQESMKEIAQLDGAFIISSDGQVRAAGRNIDAPATGLTLSKGLGSRHWAAAAISKQTKAVAIAVSESTGTVRIFQNGFVVLRIEPMERGLKWSSFETEPPPSDDK